MNPQESNADRELFRASLNAVPTCQQRMEDTDWFPAAAVSDTGEEYLFELDLPRLKREQIQISLDGNALLLVGTRLGPQSGGTSLRGEHPVGAFVRRLVLPPDSCSEELYATLQEGVLILHVPKNTPPKEKDESCASQSEEPDYEYTHR